MSAPVLCEDDTVVPPSSPLSTEHFSLQKSRGQNHYSHQLIWNADQILKYGSLRIIYSGLGTLPQTPQQSALLGAPFIIPRHAIISEIAAMEAAISQVANETKQNLVAKQSVGEASPSFFDSRDKKQAPQHQSPENDSFLSPRLATYKALHSKGLIAVDGLKFGADWLIYRGDPLVVHSEFLVSCTSSSSLLPPTDLVSMNRLATAVKKKALLSVHFDGSLPSQFNSSRGLQSYSAVRTARLLVPPEVTLAMLRIERIRDI